jgi:hypothetical protein
MEQIFEILKVCKKKLLDLPQAAADQLLEHLSSKWFKSA